MPKASLCLLLLSAVFLSSDANAKLKDCITTPGAGP